MAPPDRKEVLLIVPPPFRHKPYRRFVRNRRSYNGGLNADHRHAEAFHKVAGANLDAAYALLAPLYDAHIGRLARSPVCMLRSCLLMMLCGITSFTQWTQLMRDEPFHAIYSGFEPDDVPGVGTFYDF